MFCINKLCPWMLSLPVAKYFMTMITVNISVWVSGWCQVWGKVGNTVIMIRLRHAGWKLKADWFRNKPTLACSEAVAGRNNYNLSHNCSSCAWQKNLDHWLTRVGISPCKSIGLHDRGIFFFLVNFKKNNSQPGLTMWINISLKICKKESTHHQANLISTRWIKPFFTFLPMKSFLHPVYLFIAECSSRQTLTVGGRTPDTSNTEMESHTFSHPAASSDSLIHLKHRTFKQLQHTTWCTQSQSYNKTVKD